MCQKCGCNTCEIEIRGPLLTEGKIKGLISNNLQYHIDKNIPLMENVFRIGSDAHLSMIKEARKLYTRNALDLCEDDKALMETHIGEFDLFENEIVPLDLPMLNEVEIGDKVKIDKTYGGGKGEITNKMGSFIVVNGSSYHESDVELLDEKLKGLDGKACWKGYKLSGTKKKGGKTVDNCVPMEESVPGMHSTFEDYIDELEKTMYVDRRDGGKIFIHPLDKPGVRRPSKDYISISGNNITAVQGYNSGPIQDLADAYSSLSVDKDSRLVPMGKDYASGKASLLSSNILVDAIKAIKASRDAEAKNQQAYYSKNPKKGRIGYGLSSQPRMNESEEQYPSFEVDKNIKYQDMNITKGYWTYTGKESAGRGVYLNAMNQQMLGFNREDIEIFQKNLPNHFNIIKESLDEAEFKGKEVALGKPKRGGSKAYYVYVKDGDKVKKVTFGSGGLRAKIKNKEARNAFAARHKCKDKKDRTTAGYWSCNLPRYASQLGLGANQNTFW